MFPPGVANSMVERGVRQAFREFYSDYEVTDADYDPHVQSTSMVHDRAKSNLNDGRQLNEDEIRILLERGEIDPQKVAEHVQKNSEPHETEKK